MDHLFDRVVSLQKNSFIDFPGRASALLFYGGCNLKCPFCHNPELACGKAEPTISTEEINAFLIKRKKFLDGVVITGGEPTLYDTVPALSRYLRDELGYQVKLDSNGLRPQQIENISWDYLALDLKTSFERYESLLKAPTSVKESLLNSLDLLKAAGENGEVRITCAPGVIDESVIDELLPYLEGIHNLFLQPFKYSDNLIDSKFFVGQEHITDDHLTLFKEKIDAVVNRCEVRGR